MNFEVYQKMSDIESCAIPAIENPYMFTEKDINSLNRYLAGSNHIKRLFVTKTGQVTHLRFQYRGGFEEFEDKEGKFYSRMGLKRKSILDEYTRLMRPVDFYIPIEENEIVNEYINPNYKPAKKIYAKKNYQGIKNYENIINTGMVDPNV
jgi:hypothetical protein